MAKQSAGELLELALAEQARLGEQYDRAVGTSAEMSSYQRLHTANLHVGLCQRAVEEADPRGEPTDSHGHFAFSVDGGVKAPAEARNRLADHLEGSLDEAGLETLRLLVSELATNCVQHAGAGDGSRIHVAVSRPNGAVRVELSTAGPPFDPPPAGLPWSALTDERGRGLLIVDALARSWGVEPQAANRVWFELATSQAS